MKSKVFKGIFLFFILFFLLIVGFFSIDYFFIKKSTSLTEYYYCTLYFDKNYLYYYDKNEKSYPVLNNFETGEAIVSYYWASPIPVEKYSSNNVVGFKGLTMFNGNCRMRDYDLAFIDMPEDKKMEYS